MTYNKTEIEEYLADNNISIEQLYLKACEHGFYDLVLAIIEFYPNINLRYRYKMNLLNVVSNNHLNILKFLLSNIDTSDIMINYNRLAISAIIGSNGTTDIVEYLLNTTNIDVTMDDYYLFKLAVSKNYIDIAILLYKKSPVYILEYRNICDWILKYGSIQLLEQLFTRVPEIRSTLTTLNIYTQWLTFACPANIKSIITNDMTIVC
jgi:hypothetical protein